MQETRAPQPANYLLNIEGMVRCWEALVKFPLMLKAARARRNWLVSEMRCFYTFLRRMGFSNPDLQNGINSNCVMKI